MIYNLAITTYNWLIITLRISKRKFRCSKQQADGWDKIRSLKAVGSEEPKVGVRAGLASHGHARLRGGGEPTLGFRTLPGNSSDQGQSGLFNSVSKR